MPETLKFLVPVLLAAQAMLVFWARGAERPPNPPDLQVFPDRIGAWMQFREDPVEPEVRSELKADRLLSRGYFEPSTAAQASLFVAWFQSQSSGDRQPHSPKVCLPGSGWVAESTGEVSLETPAGILNATRYSIVKGGYRSVVLYWYQTPRRSVAGEWAAKAWLVADALRDRRTDTSLVRVIVPLARKGDGAGMDAASRFARELYPVLRDQLPK